MKKSMQLRVVLSALVAILPCSSRPYWQVWSKDMPPAYRAKDA
jgi:hypothetical protein